MTMKTILISIITSITLLCASCTYLPEEVDLISGVNLKETANYISLSPSAIATKPTGFMFYPGGFVDPHAYVSVFQELAQLGYQVTIIKTTANLAIMNAGKAKEYLNNFGGVEQWVIGGHSLGGVVASMDIDAHPDDYKGLVLFASYPSASNDLSSWQGAILSLSAEYDALSTTQEIEDNKYLLPIGIRVDSLAQMPISSTLGQSIYHEIKGGNHSQFASYGGQEGDGEATISRAIQHQEVRNYILSFFNANQW